MPPAALRPRSVPMIALYVVIGLVVIGGTTAYGVLSKTVTLTVDGRSETIRTFGGSVDDVLRGNDVLVGPEDSISIAPSDDVDDGDHIEVVFARDVTLAVDGAVSQHTVHATTVGDALDSLGVDPAGGDYVSRSAADRLPLSDSTLVVSTQKTLTVVADGKKRALTTTAPRVSDVLAESGLVLDADDEVKPALDAFVQPGQTVKVTRVEKVTKDITITVDAPVQARDDASMYKGETKVVTAGKDGKNRQTVAITLADGKERDREVLSTVVVSAPVTQIEERGTKALPNVWDRLAQCESGGNWKINTGNGFYGGLQFTASTWRAVGGSGLPHQASREEQIKRGMILQQRAGWGQWPGCTKKLGLR